MDLQLFYEALGYLASILVALSLTMRSILRLRIINLIGAICFTVYGILIHAYPVAAVNFFIVMVNLYFLYNFYQLRLAKEYFTLLEVQPDDAYLKYFLEFHWQEIQTFSPSFSNTVLPAALCFFVLRDAVPAGVLIAELQADGVLVVLLDFVIPGYRDFKVGQFVFTESIDFFKAKGVRKIYSRPGNADHQTYLAQMGFVPEQTQNTSLWYCLTVN